MRVLVTDGNTRAALAITRSLGLSGHTVHVSTPRRPSLAGLSRYCVAEHLQAGPAEGPAATARELVRIVRDTEPHMVVGVTDRTLTLLHSLGQVLGRSALPPPSRDEYERASDKVRLFENCRKTGVLVPEGFVVDGGHVPRDVDLKPLGTPVVVRPALSWRLDADRWIRGTISYEDNLAGIVNRLRVDPALRFSYLVQRRIEGEGCGLFLLALKGRILRLFAHRRLREKPPTGGVSTLCVSVEPAQDLVSTARRWVESEGWSGLAMLEFKRGSDGLAYLLEVNARPWGSLALAAAAGVDFPSDLLTVATSELRINGEQYLPGVKLRWWWGDVDHFYLRERMAGRRGLLALGVGLVHALRAGPWPDAWDTFRRDDPIPFFHETAAWISG